MYKRQITARASLNEDDCVFSIPFYFFIQFNLHLIGRKVNHQAGIVERNSNAINSTRRLFGLKRSRSLLGLLRSI